MTDDQNSSRLAEQLEVAFRETRLRPGSLAATARAGRRRRRRRQRVGSVAAAVAVGAGTATIGLLSRSQPRTEPGEPATTAGPPPPSAGASGDITLRPAEPGFVWRRVDPDSTAAVSSTLEASYLAELPNLPGVMVSTGPGRSVERRLWRSDDGIAWTEVAGLPNGATAAASWTGPRGRVYALGTMPAAAAGTVDLHMSTSRDGGATWDGATLPADNPEMAALPGVETVNTRVVGMAGAGDVVLALVHQSAAAGDPRPLLDAAGLGHDAVVVDVDDVRAVVGTCSDLPVTSDDSAPPTSSDGCLTEEVAWTEMGTAGPTLRAMYLGEPRLFASTTAGPFVEVALPPGPHRPAYGIRTLGDAVVISAHSYSPGTGSMWATSDGRRWTERALPPVDGPMVELSSGELVAFGSTGPAITHDGAAWSQGEWRDVVGDRVGHVQQVTTTPAGVTAVVAVSEPPATGGDAFPRYEILHSADGVAWSHESVAALAGLRDNQISSVARVQTAGNTVVVALNVKAADGVVPQQIVLVGSPKG